MILEGFKVHNPSFYIEFSSRGWLKFLFLVHAVVSSDFNAKIHISDVQAYFIIFFQFDN